MDSDCNKETGQCSCKCNVEGTKCDKCKPSFYGFPKTEGMETNCLGKNNTFLCLKSIQHMQFKIVGQSFEYMDFISK